VFSLKEREKMEYIILASGSPRRSEILDKAGIRHKIEVPSVNEEIEKNISIGKALQRLALKKALCVRDAIKDDMPVLAADTVVLFKGKILGKPSGEEDAYRMLAALSGKWHKVITGFCIMKNREDYICGCETTKVRFRGLSDPEIREYIGTSEPYDKAGGYGIQSLASVFVSKIIGCYFNVMGLPICKIFSILKKYDIHIDKNIKTLER
jgi:septum formation protein